MNPKLKKVKKIIFEADWVLTGSSSGFLHIWGIKGEQLKLCGAYKCPVPELSVDHLTVISRYESGSYSHPEMDLILC